MSPAKAMLGRETIRAGGAESRQMPPVGQSRNTSATPPRMVVLRSSGFGPVALLAAISPFLSALAKGGKTTLVGT